MIMDIHGGVIEEAAVNNQSSLHFSRFLLLQHQSICLKSLSNKITVP